MQDIDIYIFDLDDTLIHSFEYAKQYYYPKLAKHLNLPNGGDVGKYWGEEIIESLEHIFKTEIEYPQGVIDFLSNLHKEQPIPPIHNVIRMLSILKKHNKWVCVYSSSNPEILMTDIKYSLGNVSIDYIYSTINQETSKPSEKIVENILEQYRIQRGRVADRSKVLLIGDSVNDYLTSRNAEISFAAVLTGVTTKESFIKNGLDIDLIYTSIKEVFNPEGHGIVAIIRNERNEFLLVKEGRINNKYFNHWSGPHGQCNNDDIIEEEAVVREIFEECNLDVIPVRKLFTRSADTKVSTVSFWEAKIKDTSDISLIKANEEISQISWTSIDKIQSGEIQIYPGTIEFFNNIKYYYENITRTITL